MDTAWRLAGCVGRRHDHWSRNDYLDAQPFDRIAMWHRKGGLVITSWSDSLRVSGQDWRELTLEAYPASTSSATARRLFAADGQITTVQLRTDGEGVLRMHISVAEDGAERSWRVRLHLAAGEALVRATLNGENVLGGWRAQTCSPTAFPFSASHACGSGDVIELLIPSSATAHSLEASLTGRSSFVI